jgi:hypothetical protein
MAVSVSVSLSAGASGEEDSGVVGDVDSAGG